jgi:hypothetical protein
MKAQTQVQSKQKIIVRISKHGDRHEEIVDRSAIVNVAQRFYRKPDEVLAEFDSGVRPKLSSPYSDYELRDADAEVRI